MNFVEFIILTKIISLSIVNKFLFVKWNDFFSQLF